VTPATQAKAKRLHRERRARLVEGGEVFVVEGAHGTYIVALGGPVDTCTCRAYGMCSHVAAARLEAESGTARD
jgi:hypothetical protein